jgi:hypothetical protein
MFYLSESLDRCGVRLCAAFLAGHTEGHTLRIVNGRRVNEERVRWQVVKLDAVAHFHGAKIAGDVDREAVCIV